MINYVFLCPAEGGASMAENCTKIKLMKLYEILRTEADEDNPISRSDLCKKVNDLGIVNHAII